MENYSIWGIIFLAIQVYAAYHAFRRKQYFWAVLSLFFIFSAAFYFFLYILPELRGKSSGMGMPGGRKFEPKIIKPNSGGQKIFQSPEKKLEELKKKVAISDTVENKRKLADQHYVMEQYSEALELYESCLTGIFSDDPALLNDATKTSYLLEDYNKALEYSDALEKAKPNNPDKSHLLVKARVLQKEQRYHEAIEVLESNINMMKGEEGKYRLAELYFQVEHSEKGKELAREIIEGLDLASSAYKNEQIQWKEEAEALLKKHSV